MIVLDASAVLISLQDEPGRKSVELLLDTQSCAISIVNLCEVQSRLVARGVPRKIARDIVDELPVNVLPFERADADATATLLTATSVLGLGLGDRACLAAGLRHEAPVFTADRAWSELDINGIEITLVR